MAKLRNLQSLDLRGCSQVHNSGLAHLASLKQLTSLNLLGCNGTVLSTHPKSREICYLLINSRTGWLTVGLFSKIAGQFCAQLL